MCVCVFVCVCVCVRVFMYMYVSLRETMCAYVRTRMYVIVYPICIYTITEVC